MKKMIAIAAAALMFAGAASAQNLGGLLSGLGSALGSSDLGNTVSKVIYGFTGNLNAVDLPGNWTYTGSAIKLGSDDVLSNVAGAAASGASAADVAISGCMVVLHFGQRKEGMGASSVSVEPQFGQTCLTDIGMNREVSGDNEKQAPLFGGGSDQRDGQ